MGMSIPLALDKRRSQGEPLSKTVVHIVFRAFDFDLDRYGGRRVQLSGNLDGCIYRGVVFLGICRLDRLAGYLVADGERKDIQSRSGLDHSSGVVRFFDMGEL